MFSGCRVQYANHGLSGAQLNTKISGYRLSNIHKILKFWLPHYGNKFLGDNVGCIWKIVLHPFWRKCWMSEICFVSYLIRLRRSTSSVQGPRPGPTGGVNPRNLRPSVSMSRLNEPMPKPVSPSKKPSRGSLDVTGPRPAQNVSWINLHFLQASPQKYHLQLDNFQKPIFSHVTEASTIMGCMGQTIESP